MICISPFSSKTINLVFATDDNYIPYFSVALSSILLHSSKKNFYDIIVLDDHVSDGNKTTIEKQVYKFSNFSIRWFDMTQIIQSCDIDICCFRHLTPATYFRLWIPELFQKYQKVLYLDCDVVFLDDVAHLFKKDIGNKWVAAAPSTHYVYSFLPLKKQYINYKDYCKNILKMKDIRNYFFAGGMIFNIKKCIQKRLKKKCFETWKKLKNPISHDQDILNAVCEDHVFSLNIEWNFPYDMVEPEVYKIYHPYCPDIMQKYQNALGSIKQIHYYTSTKAWDSPFRKLSWHFWYYARFSPFYAMIIQQSKCPKHKGVII